MRREEIAKTQIEIAAEAEAEAKVSHGSLRQRKWHHGSLMDALTSVNMDLLRGFIT